MLLVDLTQSVATIKGAGKKITAVLRKIGISTVKDLLYYFPRAYSDRSMLVSLAGAVSAGTGTVKIKVIDHRLIGNKYKKFLKIIIQDTDGHFGALLCFNRNFLKNQLEIGNKYLITGKFSRNYNEIQSSSFEYEYVNEANENKIMPIYSLTEGLTQNNLRKIIQNALDKFGVSIESDLPLWCEKKYNLLSIGKALKNIHFPKSFDVYEQAKSTLIFQDFFFQKLFLLERKETLKKVKKERGTIEFQYKNHVLEHMNFSLMEYQKEALKTIEMYLHARDVFSVLLQGDVGAGKTIVALLAMLSAVESGVQVAFMVPTEVLAMQHWRTVLKFTKGLAINVALLKGNLSKSERDAILRGLYTGEIHIVIGTHALFSDDVVYKNLGFVVIDEQHRFGVEQRYKLLSKGDGVDLLLMTATPIPQSLALSLYGDLDLITMKGTITGRIPVKTWIVEDTDERIIKMHQWIRETLARDHGRAIFVYPLIEESENNDAKNLMEQFDQLNSVYRDLGCAYIHSGVATEEKDRIIEDFRTGAIKILAATTVVEVGLDVPDATVIVVENADNFGLSTLHQLRGRVGRNNKQGYMILVSSGTQLSESGKKRLEIIKQETDGFKIAEEDLIMRGPGDFIGNRQSGIFNIKLADIRKDMKILLESSEAAEILFTQDKNFTAPEHLLAKESFFKRIDNYVEEEYII